MYRLQSLAILAGLIGLFSLVGYVLFGWAGALLILGSGLAVNLLAQGGAARFILRIHRARLLTPGEAPQLFHIADNLARRARIPLPHLAVYPSDLPNAFAMSPGKDRDVVAVSSGMLNLLDGREIAGVLAHEVAHLKNRDSLINLSAGLFVQAISAITSAFGILLLFFFFTGAWAGAGGNLLLGLLLANTAPYAAYALQAALMRTRERLADRDAALLTGDPRGLASALHKLERYNRYLQGLYRRFRFIYTSEGENGPDWLRTHPPTEERVQNLLALEGRAVAHPVLASQRQPRYIAVR